LAHKNKSLLLLFFRKEESSFLKERSKELLLLWQSLPAPPGLMSNYRRRLFLKKKAFLAGIDPCLHFPLMLAKRGEA
jgi:hypothetical protein